MTKKESDIMIFLAARLVNVYGENPNTDFILAAERLSGQKVSLNEEQTHSSRIKAEHYQQLAVLSAQADFDKFNGDPDN